MIGKGNTGTRWNGKVVQAVIGTASFGRLDHSSIFPELDVVYIWVFWTYIVFVKILVLRRSAICSKLARPTRMKYCAVVGHFRVKWCRLGAKILRKGVVMEYNKDEAFRAKEIAEKIFMAHDLAIAKIFSWRPNNCTLHSKNTVNRQMDWRSMENNVVVRSMERL
eukprot:Gb_05831 [translate_table: standard]